MRNYADNSENGLSSYRNRFIILKRYEHKVTMTLSNFITSFVQLKQYIGTLLYLYMFRSLHLQMVGLYTYCQFQTKEHTTTLPSDTKVVTKVRHEMSPKEDNQIFFLTNRKSTII